MSDRTSGGPTVQSGRRGRGTRRSAARATRAGGPSRGPASAARSSTSAASRRSPTQRAADRRLRAGLSAAAARRLASMIVFDARVLIAYLDGDDPHHPLAEELLAREI